jgi:hypothetical protein
MEEHQKNLPLTYHTMPKEEERKREVGGVGQAR